MPRVKVTLTLDEKIIEVLKKIAEKDVRSVNNLIEYALIKFVEDYPKGKK